MKKENELVEAIVAGLQEKKGRDIVVADLTEIPDAVCRYFVICSGGSPLQIGALAHSVGDTCRTKAAAKPMAVDALKWAACTYVIAAIGSLATLLYYIGMANRR